MPATAFEFDCCLTPPALAKRWGITPEKVIAFIRRGELRAFDVASPGSKRPRYRILLDAVCEFEHRRSAMRRENLQGNEGGNHPLILFNTFESKIPGGGQAKLGKSERKAMLNIKRRNDDIAFKNMAVELTDILTCKQRVNDLIKREIAHFQRRVIPPTASLQEKGVDR